MTNAPTHAPSPRPIILQFLSAAALGLFFYCFALADVPAATRLSVSLIAAALVLYVVDVLEAARLGAGPRSWRNPDRWTLAVLEGWYLTIVLFMLPINSAGPGGLLTALFGGAIYGLIMAFAPFAERAPTGFVRFDLDTAASNSAPRHWFWRLWPVGAVVVSMALIYNPPTGGWSPAYVFSQMIILPFIVTFYTPAKGLPFWYSPTFARLCGVALLLCGVFIAA